MRPVVLYVNRCYGVNQPHPTLAFSDNDLLLGKGNPSKTDEFLEKFQTAVAPPPPHFWKTILRIFYKAIIQP